jgi:hypothetical protein
VTTSRGNDPVSPNVAALLKLFEKKSGLEGVEYKLRQRTDGETLLIFLAHPTDRHFDILAEVVAELGDSAPRATIKTSERARIQAAPSYNL